MRLAFKKYGENGPDLVILHGLLGSGQNWHTAATNLATGHRVFTPSLRNHGDSPHGPHGTDEMVGDIRDFLQQQGLERVFLLGHSMGGMAAMQFACRYPEMLLALIIVDVAPESQIGKVEPVLAALQAIDLQQVQDREDANRQLSAHIPQPLVRQFLLQNLKRQDDGRYAWQCNLDELHRFVREDGPFLLGAEERFQGATLFIGGERSEYRLAGHLKSIEAHFPQAALKMVPNAGHWVHFEALQPFVQIVRAFLRSTVAQAGQTGT